jgi:hypothetical protein
MRRLKFVLVGTFVTSLLLLMLGSPVLAAGTASDTIYSFDLAPANTALSPAGGMMASLGDWISVKGSGTFDPTARTVKASGSFVHYNSNGSVACQGTWKATAFTSFTDFGTNANGEEGGVLSLLVTHYCKTMGMSMTGIPMTVTSTVNAPAGSSYVEGTTVCDFTVPTGGTVVIQPEQ